MRQQTWDKLDRPNHQTIHFRCHRALEKTHRDYQTVRPTVADKYAFQIDERTGLHAHALTYSKKRMRLKRQAGSYDRAHGFYFAQLNGGWFATETYDVIDVRSGQNRKPVIPTQAAKQIARKQWGFYAFAPVRVLPGFHVCRTKDFESSTYKCVSRRFFRAGTDLQGKPLKASFRAGYRHFCHKAFSRLGLGTGLKTGFEQRNLIPVQLPLPLSIGSV